VIGWLGAILDCGPPEYTAGEFILRLTKLASKTFAEHPVLRGVPRKDKRLSIMFSGYLYHHDPPLPGYAFISNYQDFLSRRDDSEAWAQFSGVESSPFPGASNLTFVQRVGNYHAMSRDDETALREMLLARKPATAIIGKSVELMHQMADRPAANNTIGKQLSILTIPRSLEQLVVSGYYSNINTNTYYMHDMVILNPSSGHMMKDLQLTKIGGPDIERPMIVPRVGRNYPCPCGSGKKYKKCHGR
jgi:hypothetical protein